MTSRVKFLLRPEIWARLTEDQKDDVDRCLRALYRKHREDQLRHDMEHRTAEKKRMLGSFAYFFRKAWGWIEEERLIWNWHHDLLCDYLQALQAGKPFSDLIVNLPPGSTKSICASIAWPAWCFAKNPAERFLEASYDDDLVAGHSMKCRDLIESEWYQAFFGETVQVAPKRRRRDYWETTAGGYRLSTTPGGRATGRHPSIILYDDIVSVSQADREKIRRAANDWHDKTMASRGAASVLNRRRCNLQQRVHHDDMSGHLIKTGIWESLIIPMEYEPGRMRDIGLGRDPRTTPGELMWPEMFPEKVVQELKRSLQDQYAGQYQQRPTAGSGGAFKVDCLKFVSPEEVPWGEFRRVARAWDKAAGKNVGDWTAGVQGGLIELPDDRIRLYITDIVKGQWSDDEVEEQIALWAKLDEAKFGRHRFKTVFFRDPAAAGIQAANETLRRLRRHQIKAVYVGTTAKETYWRPFANAVARFEVYVVEAGWTADFVTELRSAPRGDHDDQIDAASLLYNEIIAPDAFELPPLEEEETILPAEPCANLRCDRLAAEGSDFCCECCERAAGRGDSGQPQHNPICHQRHNDLYVKKLWTPASRLDP